jgi:endoglucanase
MDVRPSANYTSFLRCVARVSSPFAPLLLTGLLFAIVAAAPSSANMDAFAYNRLLGRGMNLGNALDAPHEGAWGITLQAQYFQAVKDAGFNSVRIPIRWSAHARSQPPYAIDPDFFDRVDWAIGQVISRNMSAVINVHHYAEMDQDPVGNAPRLIALWKQIAVRYRTCPHSLLFELFNEPHDNFADHLWNDVLSKLLQTIRATNPRRPIIIGPAYWNALDHLPQLNLPKNDRRIIVTFHYYKPLQFTHQGETWLPNSEAWQATGWGSTQERDELRADFEKAAKWAHRYERPLYLGEFGSSQNADVDSRLAWISAVKGEAEKLGFSWSYWQLYSSFGVYDIETRKWDPRILHVLTERN